MPVNSHRRYCLLKSRAASACRDDELAAAWRAKHAAAPGITLGALVPFRDRLIVAGYATLEDLDGADEEELKASGLTTEEARAVLAALSVTGPV